MKKLTEKSYARITLALDIIKKNTEGEFVGFHELGIIKHQINLFDEISLFESDEMKITCNDENVPTDENNLCWKIVDLVKDYCKINKNVTIEIEKNIPAQGGLAGGSSNVATTLKLLNKLWNLNLSFDEFLNLSRKVSMDIPYFFLGKTAFDSESTGVLRKIKTEAKFNFLLILPDFGVSTPEAYKNIDYSLIAQDVEKTKKMETSLLNNDLSTFPQLMHNDFEISVFKKYPKLAEIKESLLNLGLSNVVMSGSGSTLVGLVESEQIGKEISQRIPFKNILVESL